jgi:hypothetical protein
MAAPKGNRFWELRSKHGRDKLFTTPELMWQAACEYFEWCIVNPFKEENYISSGPKGGSIIELNKMRPFTMQGLCLYLNCNVAYFRTFKAQLPDDDKGFNTILTRIEETVYNQKFSGAAAGFLNANIIARDLGLKDSSDLTTDGKPIDNKFEYTVINGKKT